MNEDNIEIINFTQVFVTLLVIFLGIEYSGWALEISMSSVFAGLFVGYMIFRYFEYLFRSDGELRTRLFVSNFIAFLVQWFITVVVIVDIWILTANVWVLFFFNLLFAYWMVLVVYWIVAEYRCD